MSVNLYIGKLPLWFKDRPRIILDPVSHKGTVVSAKINGSIVMADRFTSRGFGFVEMSTQEEAEQERSTPLHGTRFLEEESCAINEARPD